MEKTPSHYIIILCGGSGPRLWPLSKASNPKQFLKIFSSRSLLQDTINRFLAFIPKQNIYLVSNKKYYHQIRKQTNSLIPEKNILTEPEKKNTAMAIVYACAMIKKIDPNALITTAPSDHYIPPSAAFSKDIIKSAKIAHTTNTIVTIGVTPIYPNPGFGYICQTTTSASYPNVIKFIEKPSVTDAEVLIKKKALWNTGIYTFHLNTLQNELSIHQHFYHSHFEAIFKNQPNTKLLNKIYKQSDNLPFDKAISEKTKKLSVFTSGFKWSDVGEWHAIWKHLTKDKNGLATLNPDQKHLNIKSRNCLIHTTNDKLIGLVGVSNLAIIETADAILVCNLNDSYSVRDLVGKIVEDSKLKKYFLGST